MPLLICQRSNSAIANDFRSSDDGNASFDGCDPLGAQVMRDLSLAEFRAAGEGIREALCLIVWSTAGQHE